MTDPGHAPRSAEDVHAFFAAWIGRADAGEWDRFAELMHDDITLTDPMISQPARGRAEALTRAKGQYEPFPDGHMEVIGDPFVALDGPELAYRWRFVGTHLRGIDPPEGNPIERIIVLAQRVRARSSRRSGRRRQEADVR